MLFLHRDAMKASAFFQSLDNAGLEITDEELYHDYIMLSMIARVKCCLEDPRETVWLREG
jgi:hypothetical protein